ncbi:MAG TPA: hypothetical protein VGN69_09835 [Solirubrobacteraceae bacterium]|jgi:short-subunit dehydrogenase involved in D-alanine esterification of teichoic acids|nr:hypothetical protein [Solirubrobacteraceae bacterium]
MPARWLLITALLLAADYGAWRWATASDAETPAIVSGLALAPLALALVWLLARAAVSVAGHALRAGHDRLRPRASHLAPTRPAVPTPPAQDTAAERIAA